MQSQSIEHIGRCAHEAEGPCYAASEQNENLKGRWSEHQSKLNSTCCEYLQRKNSVKNLSQRLIDNHFNYSFPINDY